MLRTLRTLGRGGHWAVALAAAALVLEGAMAPAAAYPAEDPAAHSLADQRREFSLLPQNPLAAGAVPVPLLLDQREQNLFTLTAVDQPEDSLQPGPDWGGLARDSALIVGFQAVAIGVLFLLPEDVTKWNGNNGPSQWVHNVSRPTFDEDGWAVNYIGHPYAGATYYIRARERGFGPWFSFGYSALASAVYEFGVEALFEQPSIQDLIVTPIGGALIGAFVFEPIRARIKAKPELAWYDHVGLFVTDPLGAVSGLIEHLFGIKSEIRVGPKPPLAAHRDRALRQSGFGMELSLTW